VPDVLLHPLIHVEERPLFGQVHTAEDLRCESFWAGCRCWLPCSAPSLYKAQTGGRRQRWHRHRDCYGERGAG